jgi:hypothetical protein
VTPKGRTSPDLGGVRYSFDRREGVRSPARTRSSPSVFDLGYNVPAKFDSKQKAVPGLKGI